MKPQNIGRRTGIIMTFSILIILSLSVTSCKKDAGVTPVSATIADAATTSPANTVSSVTAATTAAATTTSKPATTTVATGTVSKPAAATAAVATTTASKPAGTTTATGTTAATTKTTTTTAAATKPAVTTAATTTTAKPAVTTTTAAGTYAVSSVINLTGAHDQTISGKSINGGTVPAITLTNCYNMHITLNKLGNSTAVGVYLINCKNVTVDYNQISSVSTGVYVENSTGGGIVVDNNQFKNMKGPFPRGQFVQFNTVSGPNNSISYNKGENIFGQSYPEDAINLYKSNGTSASPIKVVGNWIRGGGPSTTGGGIMLGDNGGSYEVAANNILVNPGQYGMAIAGGDHMSITNNSVYAVAQSFTNVGIYIWGQSGSVCTNSTISGNKVKFMSAQNGENDSWIGTGETTPAGWSTNVFGAGISASILPATILSF